MRTLWWPLALPGDAEHLCIKAVGMLHKGAKAGLVGAPAADGVNLPASQRHSAWRILDSYICWRLWESAHSSNDADCWRCFLVPRLLHAMKLYFRLTLGGDMERLLHHAQACRVRRRQDFLAQLR